MLPHTGKAPHPMILSIHGGPHGAYGSQFDFEFQWLAAHGYAVLYTRIRVDPPDMARNSSGPLGEVGGSSIIRT